MKRKATLGPCRTRSRLAASYFTENVPIHRSHPAVLSLVVGVPQPSLFHVIVERTGAVICDRIAGEQRGPQKEEKVDRVEVADRVVHQQTVVTVLKHALVENSYKDR